MSAWALVPVATLVTAGLAVAVVVAVLRARRRPPARPPGPRTVAELVRMRAEAAASASAAVDEPAATAAPELPVPSPAAAVPRALAVVAVAGESDLVRCTGRESATSPPNGFGDTPWGRAHRMTDAGRSEARANGNATAVGSGAVALRTVGDVDRAEASRPVPVVPDAAVGDSAPRDSAAVARPGSAVAEGGPVERHRVSGTTAGESVEPGPAGAVPAEPNPVAAPIAPTAEPTEAAPALPEVPVSATPAAATTPDERPAATTDRDEPAAAHPNRPSGTPDPLDGYGDGPPAGWTEPEPVARSRPTETEPAPVDVERVLLLRLGLLDPDAEPDPVLVSSDVDEPSSAEPGGPEQQVRFQVNRRDGSPVPGAGVSLHDDRGRHIATGYADAGGSGSLCAPHPGTYLIVSAAPDHQPGATTVAVRDESVEASLHMGRSAVLTGAVRGRHGPVVAARVVLVQDGQIVDSTRSDTAGAYRLADLATGRYGMSVVAPGCAAAAVRIDVADGSEVHRDVELGPNNGPIPEQVTAGHRRLAGRR